MPIDEPATQLSKVIPAEGLPTVQRFEIRVSGHLEPRWAAWFDGLDLTDVDDGTTVISGPVVDQSALHGLLAKLRDLGIPLISVVQRPTDEAAALPGLVDPHFAHNPPGATS